MNPHELRIGHRVTDRDGRTPKAPIAQLLRDGAQLTDGTLVAYDDIAATHNPHLD